MTNTPILDAQKELHDLYGVCQITGKMDEQSFASLRQAIQIEYQKKHKDTKVNSLADLQNNWYDDNKMRKDVINELQSGLSFPYHDPMARFVRIALALHGYTQDVQNDMYTEPEIDDLTMFSNDLGIGAKGWGMSWYDTVWMTLLSPVETQLKTNTVRHQSIRKAQQMLDYIANDLIENDARNDSPKLLENADDSKWMGRDLVLSKTNGVNDAETKAFMRLVLNYYRLYDGYVDDNHQDAGHEDKLLKSYLQNGFSDNFGDKENLVNVGLVLAGYLNQGDSSIDDIPYEDRDEAIADFKAFYQVDDGDFFVALFLGDHDQLTAKKIDFIGSLNKLDGSVNGLQSFYFDQAKSTLYFDQLHNNAQDDLTRNNDIYQMNFSLGGTNRKLTFNDHDLLIKSTDYLKDKSNLTFGHTQTLLVFNDKIFTGCNYHDTRNFKAGDNCWCKDFIVMEQNNSNKYKIITGVFDVVKSLGGNGEPYRTEMAVSPDHERVLFTPIDKNYKQWFLLYKYLDVMDALNKLDYGQALNLSKVKRDDEFNIAKFTGSDTATLKSIQGYAINDEQTIYISSERAPEYRANTSSLQDSSPSIIFRMRWNHDSTQRQYYLDLLPLDTDFFKQIGTMGKNVLVLGELEDLQYLKDGSIMLAVTWHVLKNDPSIANQPDFQITNDYINLNQIDDRVDLYQVKLN